MDREASTDELVQKFRHAPPHSAESPLQGFEFSTNGFADGVQAEVDSEASTDELVQKFRHVLPPQQSPLFRVLNFPQMVLLMVCRRAGVKAGGWRGEVQLSWFKSSAMLYPLRKAHSLRV